MPPIFAAFAVIFILVVIINVLLWRLVSPQDELAIVRLVIVSAVVAAALTGVYHLLVA